MQAVMHATETLRALADLKAPEAHLRLAGIESARAHDIIEAQPLVQGLLDDTAPYVFAHGTALMISEVRFRALEVMQSLYQRIKKAPDFGPVQVRKAMPAEEAIAQATAALRPLKPDARADLEAQVEATLNTHVRPPADHEDACRAYLVLQLLDQVPYRTEEVDPTTWMTPLQAEVARSQLQSSRPLPHLRVALKESPTDPLGYLYREQPGRRWTLDFAEGPAAARAVRLTRRFLTSLDARGVPRVLHDADGQPLRNPDGSFQLDGAVPLETQIPEELLQSMAAFLSKFFEVVIAR